MQTHVYTHTLTETQHNTTQHNTTHTHTHTHTHTNPPSHPGIGMMYSSHGEFLTLPMTVMHTASIHTQRSKLVLYAQSTSAVIQGELLGEQLGQSSTLMMMDCRVASSAVYSCCNRCTMLALPSWDRIKSAASPLQSHTLIQCLVSPRLQSHTVPSVTLQSHTALCVT